VLSYVRGVEPSTAQRPLQVERAIIAMTADDLRRRRQVRALRKLLERAAELAMRDDDDVAR
jgi:hypothetical protein